MEWIHRRDTNSRRLVVIRLLGMRRCLLVSSLQGVKIGEAIDRMDESPSEGKMTSRGQSEALPSLRPGWRPTRTVAFERAISLTHLHVTAGATAGTLLHCDRRRGNNSYAEIFGLQSHPLPPWITLLVAGCLLFFRLLESCNKIKWLPPTRRSLGSVAGSMVV